MEEKIFCLVKKGSAYRKRYDSEMCFDEYVDTYGDVPKAPLLKYLISQPRPLEDSGIDIPEFKLEDSSDEDQNSESEKS